MKKIFFNYSGEEKEIIMTNNLCLHFVVLKDKISIWHKGKIFPGDVVKDELEKNLEDSQAAVHLLSAAYENDDDCTDILQRSLEGNKKNIPVLLTSFDWESDAKLLPLKAAMLPQDKRAVDLHPNQNLVYTEIVKSVKKDLLGDDSKLSFNDRGYYFILAAIALLVGFVAAWYTNVLFGSFTISLLVFLLFVAAALFVIRKIIFPVSVTTYKF